MPEISVLLKVRDELSKKLSGVQGNLNKFGSNMTAIGKKVGLAIGGGAIAAGAGLLKLGSDFKQAFSTIAAGTGASGEALANLEADFKSVARNVPNSLNETASAIADLNTELGLTGPALQGATEAALTAGRVFKEDTGAIITNVSDALVKFGRDGEEFEDFLDRAAVVSQATGVSISGLTGLVKANGAVFQNLGFSLEETVALFGNLEGKGIQVSRLSGAMNIAVKNLADQGITDLKGGLLDVIAQIQGTSDQTEKMEIAMKTFGSRGAQEMLTAIETGGFAIEDLMDTMANAEGTVDTLGQNSLTLGERFNIMKNKAFVALEPLATKTLELAEVFMDRGVPAILSFAGAVRDQVQPAVEAILPHVISFATTFKDQILPAIVGIGEQIGKTLMPPLEKLVKFLRENESAMQAVGVAVGTILVVAFTAWAVAAGAAAVATIAAAAPVLALLVAVGALGAGIFLLVKHWDTITAKYPQLQKILDALKAAFEAVKTAAMAVVDWFQKNWSTIESVIRPVIDQAIAHIELIITTAENVISFFKNVFTGDWEGAWEDVKDIVNGFVEFFETTLDNAIAFVTTLGPILLSNGKTLFDNLLDAVESVWSTKLKPWFRNLPSNIKDAIVASVFYLKDAGTELGDAILDGLRDALSNTLGFAGDVGDAVLGAVKSIINQHIIDPINRKLEFSVSLGPLGSVSINPPDIPHLALGGIVTSPTLAVLGDNPSRREAVVPLERAGEFGFGGGGVQVVVPPGFGIDEDDLAHRMLLAFRRQGIDL